MALPVAGGDEYPPFRPSGGPCSPAKRRTADTVDDDYHHHHYYLRHKRPKYAPLPQFAGPVAFKVVAEPQLSYPPLHHRYTSPRPHLPSPEPSGTGAGAPAMERTASGHSIRPDPTDGCASTELLEDGQAAQRVRDHLATFRRRNPDSKHERILRSIINPRPRRHHHHHRHPPPPPPPPHHHHRHHHQHQPNPEEAEEAAAKEAYPLDNEALESIFSAANEIFFNGRLSQRVSWDWSHASSSRYDSRVVGTTALRRAAAHTRGFETLIVLSSTILRDARYSRRLLISTFLHELIHCYLFICCGFRARWCGGHTPGFRDIAGVIHEWVGEGGGLFLRRVEADLELFRVGGGCCGKGRDGGAGAGGEEEEDAEMRRGAGGVEGRRGGEEVNVYPCSGMAVEQDEYAAPAVGTPLQEVVYFRGGGSSAPNPAPGGASPEIAYFARGYSPSPISRPGTPTQETMHYYSDRAVGAGGGSGSSSIGIGIGSNNSSSISSSNSTAWWRQRRVVRPLYVYSGDEPTASYVFSNTMGRGP